MKVPKNIFDLFRLDDLKKRLIFFISKYHNGEYAINPTTSLPNYKTLHEHIKRIWYISLTWYVATKLPLNHIHPFENDPIDYGNQLSNNHSRFRIELVP